MSDWRLNGQERYLYGVKLKHMNIKDKLNPSDHEHCEFCLEKYQIILIQYMMHIVQKTNIIGYVIIVIMILKRGLIGNKKSDITL